MRQAVGLSRELALLLLLPLAAAAQARLQVELVRTIESEERVLAAGLSADGRLAYAVEKRVEYGQRWQRRAEVYVVALASEEKKRILRHDFFEDPFNPRRLQPFSVDRLAWSPDGSLLAVEISHREGSTATFFFKSTGGAVKLGGGGNVVGGYGATWLADNSVGMLDEVAPPRLLHRVSVVRLEAGRAIPLFRPRTFAAAAWVPGKMQVVLVERDKEFAQPPRLLLGDLTSGGVTELGPEPDYMGGLRATPEGEWFSYFAGQKKLVLRKLAEGIQATISIPFAHYEWLGIDGALAYVESERPGKPNGWLMVWDPETQASHRLLPEERIVHFWVAPGGSHIAVLTAEEPPLLKVYRLEVPAR